jgi:NADPH-dependent ferric siderophore reductase
MAGESQAMRTLRQHYLQERGLAPRRLHAQGYWKAGQADHREG